MSGKKNFRTHEAQRNGGVAGTSGTVLCLYRYGLGAAIDEVREASLKQRKERKESQAAPRPVKTSWPCRRGEHQNCAMKNCTCACGHKI